MSQASCKVACIQFSELRDHSPGKGRHHRWLGCLLPLRRAMRFVRTGSVNLEERKKQVITIIFQISLVILQIKKEKNNFQWLSPYLQGNRRIGLCPWGKVPRWGIVSADGACVNGWDTLGRPCSPLSAYP